MKNPFIQRPTTRKIFIRGIGILQLFQGFTWLDPVGFTVGREAAFSWTPIQIAWIPGVFLITSGVLCLLAAIFRKKLVLERIAFTLAMFPYAFLAGIFLVSSLSGVHPTGFISTISYSAFAYLLWLAAGILDVPKLDTDIIDIPPQERL